MSDHSYIGRGSVYVGPKDGSTGLIQIGNVSKLEFSFNEDKKELQDYRQASGGLQNSVSRISAVTAEMTLHDFSAENLAMAFRGTATAVSTGAVSNESITAKVGALVPTAHLLDPAQTVTVTTDPAGITYAVGVDYEVKAAGILILAGGSISDDESLLISYTQDAALVVQTLVSAGQEFMLYFDGLNEAQSGRSVVSKVHRCKFSPAQNFGLLGDDFASFDVTVDVLADASITTAGLSQFFQVSLATA